MQAINVFPEQHNLQVDTLKNKFIRLAIKSLFYRKGERLIIQVENLDFVNPPLFVRQLS